MHHSSELRRLGACALAATLIAATAAPALADEADMVTYARQGIMNAMQWDANVIYAMAKGKIPYDAEVASERAAKIQVLAGYDIASLFLDGTSKPERPGKTRAEPSVWDEPLKFEQGLEDLRAAMANVVTQVGAGEEEMIAAATELGQTCGGCHKQFRAKEY
jgi:cytochrome c556